jgi:ribonucleotide reductase alpha subunit
MQQESRMLETTPVPQLNTEKRAVKLTDNARVVLMKRYVRRGPDGQPAESPEGLFHRVAQAVAEPDRETSAEVEATARAFYQLLTELRFFPNSPTFTGAGTPLGQLAACFVLPISDDMGRDSAGIFQTLRDAALIQQTGGGNGFSFGRLRPKGAYVASSAGQATGPVGFLRVYDKAFGEIAQGGIRRGASMAVLPVHHPDILDFINCKVSENQITNFNISVGITDKFMAAVRDDADFELISPNKGAVLKTVRAKNIFDAIVKNAYRNGEPGVLFLDAANRQNPVPHLYALEATNPCHRGDNLVHTSLGLVPIRELVGRTFEVVTPGGDIVEAIAFPTGRQALYRVYLDNGAAIDLTANHNLVLEDGRKCVVSDLQPGNRLQLATHSIEPTNPCYQFSHEEGMLLGWNAGDGWVTFRTNEKVRAWQVGFVFGYQDESIARWVEHQVAERIGAGAPALKPRADRGVFELATTNKDFTRYFLTDLGAVNKRQGVPETVLQGNREFQRGYLRGLFSADGYVSVKGGGQKERRQLGLVSAHEQLARKVQVLLSTFGVVSRLRHSQSSLPGRDKKYDRWQLTINANQFVRFVEEIGFMPGSAKQAVAETILGRKWRDTHSDTCAAVVRVEPLNIVEPVFNLTVNHPLHQFAVNGLISANCGEQFLGPYENCCLGSINLAQHVRYVGDRAEVDWKKLQETVELSTHFLDNVVTANQYVPAVPQLAEAAHRGRRIGLGIMGLGDLMYHLGIRYGSEEGQEFAAQVMEFVRYHCMQTSIQLAAAPERGAFPAIEGSLYDPKNLAWSPPQPIAPYTHDWGRPAIEWAEIVQGIRQYGIRNAAQTTVAPTGTIATVAGCEAYGCEPVFALAYMRHVVDTEAGGQDGRTTLTYASPLFEQALIRSGVDAATRQRIYAEVLEHGSCQHVADVPDAIRHTFVVSADIAPDEHVRMQAAIQAFVDNSISKTCNFPESAVEADVAKTYFLAWELGCKGLTVYVTGSRDKVVLETKATAKKREEKKDDKPAEVPAPIAKKPRPRRLRGETFRIGTPLGTAFITINTNGDEKPFEVFLNVGKAGSDTAAVAEALGRIISLALRLPSPMNQTERLKLVTEQLAGIGGGRSLGFGPNRVRSLPDGVAQALAEFLGSGEPDGNGNGQLHAGVESAHTTLDHSVKIGDLCPECGEATYVNEEGCRKCYSCGHSEC